MGKRKRGMRVRRKKRKKSEKRVCGVGRAAALQLHGGSDMAGGGY